MPSTDRQEKKKPLKSSECDATRRMPHFTTRLAAAYCKAMQGNAMPLSLYLVDDDADDGRAEKRRRTAEMQISKARFTLTLLIAPAVRWIPVYGRVGECVHDSVIGCCCWNKGEIGDDAVHITSASAAVRVNGNFSSLHVEQGKASWYTFILLSFLLSSSLISFSIFLFWLK